MKKISILGIVPALMPSVNIGIINPMKFLQEKGKINFKVTLPYLFKSKILDNIDCVIFCRNSFPNEEWILNEVVTRGIPYIYEIDDNFFEIPYDNKLGRNHRHPINLSCLINFISYASVVRTYSKLLADDASFYNKSIEKNKVYFDFKLIENLKQDKTSKIKIVYATSRMADSQQDIFNEALKKIAKNYTSKVEIYFFGAPIVDKELKTLSNVFHFSPIYSYSKFIKKFFEMGFDIGLAPIFEGNFFNSKTNNKYREYGACKIAGIYSNEKLYSSCIINERNGLLVENKSEEWYLAIEKLINDERLRNNIICSAYDDIKDNYSFEHYCDVWIDSIQKAIINKTSQNKLDSYWHKNSYINTFMLFDLDIGTEQLFEIKEKLLEDIYLDSKVKFCSIAGVEIDDMYKANFYLENCKNILLVSNSKEWIKYFDDYSENNKLNFLLLTNLEQKECDIFKNIYSISLKKEKLPIYSDHRKNVYLNIDYNIKKYFEQTDQISIIKKIILKISGSFFVSKISYFMQKKNSIKLRFYSWWEIYKINKNSS